MAWRDLINRRNAQLTAAIAERANNMLLIKSMGTEEKEAVAGEARMKASYQAEVTDLWVRGLALPINAIASALQSVAIILAGRAFLQHRRTGPDPVDRLLWVCNPAHKHPQQLLQFLVQLQGGAGVCGPRVPNHGRAGRSRWTRGCAAEVLRGNISLRDVCFSYGNTALFTGLNAEIPAGKITAIVGPFRQRQDNAAEPDRPAVPAGKGDHRRGRAGHCRISLHSFRQAVGYVTQESVMYSGTIRQNLSVWFGPHAGRPGTGPGL